MEYARIKYIEKYAGIKYIEILSSNKYIDHALIELLSILPCIYIRS